MGCQKKAKRKGNDEEGKIGAKGKQRGGGNARERAGRESRCKNHRKRYMHIK